MQSGSGQLRVLATAGDNYLGGAKTLTPSSPNTPSNMQKASSKKPLG